MVGMGQVSGKIVDIEGSPLAFASIYIENSSSGTFSNQNGEYKLDLSIPGNYTINCAYVGYETESININIKDLSQPKTVNFQLKEASYVISAIMVNADAEDPAYAIMRNVIKYKNKNNPESLDFQNDLYIKGVLKLIDAPEKFLNQNIGDLDGLLDSTRNAILYLSESKAKIRHRAPRQWKEEIYAGKTSGSQIDLTMNNYSLTKINYYNNYIELERTLVSPLNDHAFDHYRFRYDGSVVNNGRLTHKIAILPKSNGSPCFKGYLFIDDRSYALTSLDLKINDGFNYDSFLDSLNVKQVFMPWSNTYVVKDQTSSIYAHFFAFKASGYMVYSFSDYEVLPSSYQFDENVLIHQPQSIDQSELYWDSIRPVPLLIEEKKDYVKRDSLYIIRNSKSYLDSLDSKSNAFHWYNPITGYTWNNSFEHKQLSFSSLLTAFQFNAIEGWNINYNLDYEKANKNYDKVFALSITPRYGFADKKFKFSLEVQYKFNKMDRGRVKFSAGNNYQNFYNETSFFSAWNTFYSLFYKDNESKWYQSKYAQIDYSNEITNNLYVNFRVKYEQRNTLKVNTNYSFFYKNDEYESNDFPSTKDVNEEVVTHGGLLYRVSFKYRPFIKVYQFGNFKSKVSGGWPTFKVQYEQGIPLVSGDVDFSKIRMGISWDQINLKLWGYTVFNVTYGLFLHRDLSSFVDRFHFGASQNGVYNIQNENATFLNMPQYKFSTNQNYLEIHLQQHFNGYIMDMIPYLRDLDLKFVVGTSYLNRTLDSDYLEWNLGIENIGIGPIKFLRVDYVWQYDSRKLFNSGFNFGFLLNL